VVESNGQDVQVPWFSGLCLEGEVAGQYEMDLSGSQLELESSTASGLLELDGLGPITIFVGANNSGKSRLMRELFRTQQPNKLKLKSRHNGRSDVDIGSKIPNWINMIGGHVDNSSTNGWIIETERSTINANLNAIDSQISKSQDKGLSSLCENLKTLAKSLSEYGIKHGVSGLHELNRCYVPMIRGMRPPLTLEQAGQVNIDDKDWYKLRTTCDHFANHGDLRRRNGYGEQQIFSGLGLYTNLRERLLARTQTIRDSVRDYESFLSKHFFPGKVVTLIPVEEGENDVVHIKIGNNKEYPIYDLGDGMQSLIICTYPIVTETKPGSLFFLEEPDLCMHPSLQRTFLEVLKTYHRKMGHQFFITTHSNHLLDLLEDNELVSIFSFSEIADRAPDPADSSQPDNANSSQSIKPKPSFRIRPSTLRDRQTLLELGVRPSATYLANATIWVEGVSDSAYLKAYMEAFVHYLKHLGNGWGKALAERLEQYKEDRHYAFVEYSGANLTHFSFEERESDNGQTETSVSDLCGKAIVIADGDIVEKDDRISHFVDQLKERFICLPCKEIENLIPEELMKKQIRLDHAPPHRGDVDEDAIENLNYAAYARSDEGLGKYLGNLGITKYSGTTGNGGGSGTLPTTYKSRWRRVEKGIPALIHNQIDVVKNPVNSAESIQADDLPDYLTQDLIWLCILLYIHIAGCNYDKNTENHLKELQGHIENQVTKSELESVGEQVPDLTPNVVNNSMAETIDQAETIPNRWPIPLDNTSSRSCLLKNFSPSAA
jgi:predicted ATPase